MNSSGFFGLFPLEKLDALFEFKINGFLVDSPDSGLCNLCPKGDKYSNFSTNTWIWVFTRSTLGKWNGVFAFLAFSAGAEVAKLVPIYNTNTLIAVILGLLLLHEVPAVDERIKVIIGAILIVIGGILVSR